MSLRDRYNRDAERLAQAMMEWVERESETRLVDLRWREWGDVCYAGTLEPQCLDILCESDDAKAMMLYADGKSGHKATLLMAYVIAETLGLKTMGKGSRPILPEGIPICIIPKGGPKGAPN